MQNKNEPFEFGEASFYSQFDYDFIDSQSESGGLCSSNLLTPTVAASLRILAASIERGSLILKAS